ncbi:uncharacterized protein LOC127802071 isoform X3 [Diospyros lotus]|uniref:uncharacterized protein LOC127802071 isoform X3 n=1 Tax=Diospyros lotus TaxID=55363 RepID=UPI0022532C3D|nr:uncharacterized protein LOC127802071 isoform X3 [Diospyros lotus]
MNPPRPSPVNSLPCCPDQVHKHGTTDSSAFRQVIQPNQFQGNPNPTQTQPQKSNPFNNNYNSHLGNGPFPIANRPISVSMASPNNPNLQLQQNGVPFTNLSHVGLVMNPMLQPNQFAHSPFNLPQFLGQNAGFLNGQLGLLTQLQNVNQLMQMPISSYPHGVPCNMPLYPNQVSQALVPQNPTILANPWFGVTNCNAFLQPSNQGQPNFVMPAVDANATKSHNVTRQLQGNSPLLPAFGSVPPQQNATQQFQGNSPLHPAFGSVPPHQNATQQFQGNSPLPPALGSVPPQQNATQQLQGNSPLPLAFGSVPPQQIQMSFQPPDSKMSKGNCRNGSGVSGLNAKWKDSQNRNFNKNPKRDALHRGFPNDSNMKNVKGKYGFHNKYGGNGYRNDSGRKSELANSANQNQVQHRRFPSLNYTGQEIQKWREERRKNYPSRANVEKKLAEKTTDLEVNDEYAKLRRKQLKEILAKQAELGCEVAEIPSYYLSDPEEQVHGKKENKVLAKKEYLQNKFRNGRFSQNKRFKKHKFGDPGSTNTHDQGEPLFKKQKLVDNDSLCNRSLDKRQPTLLQKLLSANIRRDRSRLLQVFRFMVINSFFKDWPEKPLRFPSVIVKEETGSKEVVEGKTASSRECLSGSQGRTTVEERCHVNHNHSDDGNGDGDDNGGNRNNEFGLQETKARLGSLENVNGGRVEESGEEGEIID